jgi:hypothetical protein
MVLCLTCVSRTCNSLEDYVGLELAMQVVVNYDQNILMSLLLTIYHALTPN